MKDGYCITGDSRKVCKLESDLLLQVARGTAVDVVLTTYDFAQRDSQQLASKRYLWFPSCHTWTCLYLLCLCSVAASHAPSGVRHSLCQLQALTAGDQMR